MTRRHKDQSGLKDGQVRLDNGDVYWTNQVKGWAYNTDSSVGPRDLDSGDRIDYVTTSGDPVRRGSQSYSDLEHGCFVATTVYGDTDASQVQSLRGFRDDVLMGSKTGRKLVDFYYSGAGEKVANFIKEHVPSTIPAIRRGLDFIVGRYSAQRN